jgi:hypothetical protein
MRIFDVLSNGKWPKFSTHAPEKGFENPDFLFCSSFQNLRLGSITFESKDDDSMTMRLSKSQDDDGMTMRLSNSESRDTRG